MNAYWGSVLELIGKLIEIWFFLSRLPQETFQPLGCKGNDLFSFLQYLRAKDHHFPAFFYSWQDINKTYIGDMHANGTTTVRHIAEKMYAHVFVCCCLFMILVRMWAKIFMKDNP